MNRFATPLAFLILTCWWDHSQLHAQAVKVDVRQSETGNWQLYRDGEPYYVRGAGGHVNLDKLVEIGGNSIRTWSTDHAGEILDEAYARGLTVMLGLWVQHERHGFDYSDTTAVRSQLEGFRKVVMAYKDHPALLLWGIGNEVDLFYTNTSVWYAVNDIARMIHEADPNHPTCTVTAGLDPEEVRLIRERAPHIDIYGINTYGDLGKVKAGIRQAGWQGPYMITEWGPNGHWEVERTAWGAPVEQSSSEKASSYEARYRNFIASDTEKCVGSYVFLWGQKQETTATWYGLFSDRQESSEAIDILHTLWRGSPPANRCPTIQSASINRLVKGEFIRVTAEERMDIVADVTDPDGDPLAYRWMIIPESTDIRSGGDAESAPTPVSSRVLRRNGNSVSMRAPAQEGPYRLFLLAYDGKNHYAYTNIPFYVIPRPEDAPPARAISFKRMNPE